MLVNTTGVCKDSQLEQINWDVFCQGGRAGNLAAFAGVSDVIMMLQL